MKRHYRLSRAARTDLLQIWNYLAESASFDVADKVIADLNAGMEKVARTPALGHVRPDLTDDPVKFFLVHLYLIVFVPGTKPLGIARILHSARDVKAILGE
jgi:toxin ParE1/3/4